MESGTLPKIGEWYKTTYGDPFRVIAIDDDNEAIEIQYINGDLEEFDFESVQEMELETLAPPEDWSAPYGDLETDDLGYSDSGPASEVTDFLSGIERDES
ncbi:MAG: hypothetical protein PVG89_06650 [Gammaproteobacteria bacterium]|jgi:hypothetical protein